MEALFTNGARIAILSPVASTGCAWQSSNDQKEGNIMILPVTLSIAGGAALINLWLAIRVGQVRTKEKVSVGDGGNDSVIRRMRAHSNFSEFTPIVLILLGLVEMATGSSHIMLLWAIGGLFLIGRVCHAIGMDGWSLGRPVGMLTTMLATAALGLYAIAIPHLNAGQVEPETEAVANG
jgi:uncharacterized protein